MKLAIVGTHNITVIDRELATDIATKGIVAGTVAIKQISDKGAKMVDYSVASAKHIRNDKVYPRLYSFLIKTANLCNKVQKKMEG